MYGFQLVRLFEEMNALGLVSSREQYSRHWCGRNPGYLRDYMRRDGATSRVSPEISATGCGPTTTRSCVTCALPTCSGAAPSTRGARDGPDECSEHPPDGRSDTG
jgi:hypothetical protein